VSAPGEDSDELRKLVEECRERPFRTDAWDKFYHRYDYLICVYVNACARSIQPQDRDDICQKVWIRMPAILDRFDPSKGPLSVYLRQACRWAALKEFRHFQREREFERPADETILQLVRESPEEQSPGLLRFTIGDYLLKKVPDVAKLLIYMDWIEGVGYREIMAKHKVSRALVFRRFEECRRLVKAALRKREN
jgi:RNA polymerase sigma factor (sigma-70 family)